METKRCFDAARASRVPDRAAPRRALLIQQIDGEGKRCEVVDQMRSLKADLSQRLAGR
jgi:hypothetical protein